MSFEPTLKLRDFSGGLNTKMRPNKIAANQMKSILSMDFVANSMQRAKGYTKLGTEADDTLTGKTLYTHTILAGQDVLIKTIGTYLKFYDSVDDAWYKLTDSTFTTDLRWSFATFNSYLYGVNGIDNWIFWKGSTLTTIVNAITAISTTIDLAVGKGALYPASGTVMIQNEEIAYTGKAADQLTGCTITASHGAGSAVCLKVDSTTYSGLTKAKQIAFFKNRMYAVDYATPTFLRHSVLADNTTPETDLLNFTVGGGAGDAGYGIAPDELVSIKALTVGSQSSVLMALGKDGVAYHFQVIDGSATTTNAFVPMRIMNSYPVAKQMVEVVENDIMFIDQFGHARTLNYGDVNTPLNVQTISQFIEPSLEAMDFSDGAIKSYKRKVYIAGKTSTAASNDLVFYHDANYNAWGAYSHWDAVDFSVYNDVLYALSAISGDVWKLEQDYNANDGQYYSEMITGDLDWGYPLFYKKILKLRMSGYITSNCDAYIDLYFDNSTTPITYLINGDNTNIIGGRPNVAVGSVVFGSGVFGGGLPGGVSRRDFVAELMLNDLIPFLKVAIKIRIDSQDVDFEANDMVLWAELESTNLWLNSKTLART